MAKVVIFGIRDFASLAHFYLRHDSPHQVVAFAVHRQFLPPEQSFEGLPVVPLDALPQRYGPDEVSCFAPMSPRKMNSLRTAVYQELKGLGYRLISYVSSRATLFPGTPIGENCFILEDNTLQPYTRIGDNVVLWSGNHVGHHSVIEDHTFFASHVVLSGHCIVEKSCFLGVNATVRDGLRLAEGTLLGMASCLAHDTEPWSVYRGNPARRASVSSKDVEL